MNIPKAKKALQDEWDNLYKNGVFDMNSVREWYGPNGVAQEAIDKGIKIHVGDAFEICVLKGSELPDTPENFSLEEIQRPSSVPWKRCER